LLTKGLYFKHITIKMMPLELSVSKTTIGSITLESSITLLEASFTLIYNTGITSDDCQLMISPETLDNDAKTCQYKYSS